MTTLEKSRLEMPVRGEAIGGDWLHAQPGEWVAVRLSSVETDGCYTSLLKC